MTNADEAMKLRRTGIEAVGDVPWGTHFCQFYETKDDLVSTLVPYFREGLAANEFCMWVTSHPLAVDEATAALRAAEPGLDGYLSRGQIEILDYSQWYTKTGRFDEEAVLAGWMDKLAKARERGFAGLRLTGNTFWLEDAQWSDFAHYEERVNSVIGATRMLAVCTYSLEKCGALEIAEVLANHQFALIKRRGRWESIESARHRQTEAELRKYQHDLEAMVASRTREVRQAAEALATASQYARSLIESSLDPLVTIGADGKIMDVNEAATKVRGATREELIGTEFASYFTEPERARAGYEKAFREGFVRDYPLEIKHRDGSTTPVIYNATVYRGPDGEVAGVFAAARDVSELRKAEEAARESDRQLRAALDNMMETVIIWDRDLRYVYANREAEKFIGLTAREIVGRPVTEVVPDVVSQPSYQVYKRVLATGRPETFVMKRDRPVGTVNYFRISVEPVRQGILMRAVAVTDSVQAEERQRYLVNLLANMSDAVVSVDPGHGITSWNGAAERMYGWKADEVLGKSFKDLAGIEPSPAEQEAILKALDENGTWHGKQVHRNRTGGKLLVDVGGSHVRDERGNAIGAVLVIRDETAQRRAEEEAGKLKAQLAESQKMEAVGRLAGGVAHDFNNMLAAIIGNADLTLSDMKKKDPLRENVQDMRDAAQRAAELTEQLLAFSRRQITEPRPVDLNALVARVGKMLKRIVGEDIELKTFLARGLWTARADPAQIDQIITNLAVNARDAMPRGGRLTIETANVDLDRGYLKTHPEASAGPHVMLAVSDTGRGMDEETKTHVFEPFYTTKEMGTGLGLSIVYGIVKQAGGSINVYSEPGKGSSFKIYLPRVDAPAAVLKAGARGPAKRGAGVILLVEDEATLLKVTKRGLERHGYRVLAAGNGKAGLAVSSKHQGEIDLLMTDVVMPEMGGRELAEKVAKARPAIKVLYTSGYTTNAIVHRGELDPGTNFIQKPYAIADLIRKVQEVMEGKGGRRK